MKHYCIPVLGTKPKHAIIHCGTNDLRASSSQEITKQMGELCELIIDNFPDIHITISSLLIRSDKEGKKVAEVNSKLKLLCSENNFSFLLHFIILVTERALFKVRDCCEWFVYKYTHELNVQ